jgi:hypothetical protein
VAGEAPFGAGETPRFAVRGGAGAAALASRFPGLLEAQPRPPCGDGLVSLVRPDGYLAAQVADADWRALIPSLEKLSPQD